MLYAFLTSALDYVGEWSA